MPGSFMPGSFRPKLALPMALNILRIWAYCPSSWLTPCTLVAGPGGMEGAGSALNPEPRAREHH